MTGSIYFETLQDAYRYMEVVVDQRVDDRVVPLHNGFELRIFSRTLGDTFTNVYDLSWPPGNADAVLNITARPQRLAVASGTTATTTAAFFVLADTSSGLPRQASLNLAIHRGRIRSLPVVDREALICRDGDLGTTCVPADGELDLNGKSMTWAGSLTGRRAQSYVFGNGNIAVRRVSDPRTGTLRTVDEASRWTPAIPENAPWVDVGFAADPGGAFRSAVVAEQGGLDISAYDIVVRCERHRVDAHGENSMFVTRVGPLRAAELPDGAVSVGPSLDVPHYAHHPINRDSALGEDNTFADGRKARMVLFGGRDERTHVRLFDGRPGSPTFQGPTPAEARDMIAADTGYRWGCFLDGGQTAKIWTADNGKITNYGNRHLLHWPKTENGYLWSPDTGRAVASSITFHAAAEGPLTVDYMTPDVPSAPERRRETVYIDAPHVSSKYALQTGTDPGRRGATRGATRQASARPRPAEPRRAQRPSLELEL